MPVSRTNGVDIWYEVKGDGPAMVLVHANPFDHDLWMYQSAHFSTWFKVIGVDIRGYGRSAKVTTPYSLKDMCDDVVGVTTVDAVRSAGGHSMVTTRTELATTAGDPLATSTSTIVVRGGEE